MSTTEKLAPGTRRIDLGDGRYVTVRKATMGRARRFQEMIRLAGDANEEQTEASMLVARWGLIAAGGLANEDGDPVEFTQVDDDQYGKLAAEYVIDALYPDELVRIINVVSGVNFVSETEAGN